MDEKITMVGVAVLAVGLLLLFGFMPLIGESADKVSDNYDEANGDFRDYKAGDKVTVYGKITDIEYNETSDFTTIELDNEDSKIHVSGDLNGTIEKGERVYIKCFVDDRGLQNPGKEYLRANPDDIHSQMMPDIIFILIIIAGIVVMAVGIRSF
jgi:hypothetical protein